MPAEAAAPLAQSNPSIAPKKKSAPVGKAALAKVTLLDGSVLDVTIDRKAKGRDLLNSICAGLNIAERDYFGLLYSTELDPRNWLELEKPVSKYLTTDPWVLRFVVKFYPPEPAQLQEDITRYHLCLQIRNDILDGRLPCSFVTHALLGSYLVQSEVGDFDTNDHKNRRYLDEFKFAPSQTDELVEKVHDLHKTHRGQTPAEAELHYLENAKKLAMYGCDFHPALDSEGVDIMICICASGILVYKDKLRINRFAWPKILKISYKHHDFYIKIRPAEFEQFESTVYFRLVTHRACKKLWKSSVEHHTFFRLMTPEIVESTFFPKIGSKFRYSGRTMHQTKHSTLERPAPNFERSLTGKRLTSRSMDAIVLEKDKPAKRKFIGSRSPDSVPDDLGSAGQKRSGTPAKKGQKDKGDKDNKGKKPIGGLSALQQFAKSGKNKENENDTGSDPNETIESLDRSPKAKKKGFLIPGISLKDKSPKDKSGSGKKKDGKDQGHDQNGESPTNDVTRPYEYDDTTGGGGSPTKRGYKPPGGFRYDEPPHKDGGQLPGIIGTGQVPQGTKPAQGLAFNYAPGGNDALKGQAQKLKSGELSPTSKGKPGRPGDIVAPRTPPPAVPSSLGPKTPTTPISPGSDRADTTDPFLNNERLAAQTPIGGGGVRPHDPQKIRVKILLIISRYDPKTKRIDTVNGNVEHINDALLNPATGKIDSRIGVIDARKATVEVQNKDTGKITTYQGVVDSKTGNIHLTSGVIDRKTGIVNTSLGQIICIAPEDNSVIEVTGITGKLDADGKVDIANSDIERSRGLLNLRTSFVDTKYGSVNPKTGEVHSTDSKGKPTRRSAVVDASNGQVTITGVPDAKGKIDNTIGQLIAFGTQIDPIVEITVVSGKVDKKSLIDTKAATIENSTGLLNTKTGKIDTKYGQLDLVKHTIVVADPKSGKAESKDIKIDPLTGQILIKNCVNPKTGKSEKDYGQLMSLKIVNTRLDPSGKVVSSSDGKDIIVDPKTNRIWIADSRDPKTNDIIYSSSQVDPRTGTITIIFGLLNPKTNEIEKQTKTDPNLYQVDESGQIFASTGEDDASTQTPLYAATHVEPSGNVVTKIARCDPKTGKITIIRVSAVQPPATPSIDASASLGKSKGTPAQSKSGKGTASPTTPLSVLSSVLGSLTSSSSSQVTPPSGSTSQTSSTSKTPTSTTTPSSSATTPTSQTTSQGPQFALSKAAQSVKKALFPDQPKTAQADKTPQTQQRTAPAVPTAATGTTANVSISVSTGPKTAATATITPAVSGLSVITESSADEKPSSSADSTARPLSTISASDIISSILSKPADKPPKAKITVATPASASASVTLKAPTIPSIPTTPTTPTTPITPVTPLTPGATTTSFSVPIVPQKNAVIEIISLTGKLNARTGKVDVSNADLERTTGILDVNSGFVKTKYGDINPKTRELRTIADPKTGKSITKAVSVDSLTGQIAITGVVNPKNGKVDSASGHLISFGAEIHDPVVEVTAISGKYDSRKNIIDPKTASVSSTLGHLDVDTGVIATTYGELNLNTGKITSKNPKTQKMETKDIKIDPTTGQVILRNEINPKNNKPDKDYGRIISLRIVNRLLNPVTGIVETPLTATNDIIVDPTNNKIWVPESKDSSSDITYSSASIDPLTGFILAAVGHLNPKTNRVDKQTGVETKVTKIDPSSGQVFVATGKVDETTGEALYATSQVDEESGEVYTKVAKVDPLTGKMILIKIILITKKDASGIPQEIDPQKCDIDPLTGRVQNIFNKTVYVYNMVDPVTGEIIQVDPNDPRVAGARTTVTQTMTLTGKIDEVTGRIITEYGHINPDTGDIDPATAVKDPVTGKLILNYAQIDPSHFGKEVTVVKETTPITRDQFFEGVKHLGPAALRHPSEGEEEDLAQYVDSSKVTFGPGKYNTPKVVKTTTKQVITKNDDGVTHNVEEEIRNLGTGEVVFSTQEHKADADESSSGNYVTATAVTTRTATTTEDLAKNAKTQQLEEKTVATHTTHNLNRQEQRVVTQEVKTTATVTSGEQFNRRDSVSSNSSADSGTPIDGPYEPSSSAPKEMKKAGSVTVIDTATIPEDDSEPQFNAEGEEIVSTQTVSSKTRTVETITYKTERDGIVETRVEQKITIQSDGDPIDHDTALAEAIQEATAMNPDMTVEKIEIQQQRE